MHFKGNRTLDKRSLKVGIDFEIEGGKISMTFFKFHH